jgi:dienelactone hydrolase
MPDMFAGDTAPGAAIADDSTSVLEQIKIKAVEMAKSFVIDMWLARITADKVMPVLHKVIEAAREQYADAVRHGDGIYAVGYCVGARFVMLLAKQTEKAGGDEESAKEKEGPYIKAGALAHAASVIPDDFKDLKAPLSFVCVENDPLFPDTVRSAGEDIMSDANLEHEVQVYPGVPHGEPRFPRPVAPLVLADTDLGFAVVGEYQDSSIKDAQATAYEQMLKWVQDH